LPPLYEDLRIQGTKKADKYTNKQTNKRVEHETNIKKVNRRTRS